MKKLLILLALGLSLTACGQKTGETPKENTEMTSEIESEKTEDQAVVDDELVTEEEVLEGEIKEIEEGGILVEKDGQDYLVIKEAIEEHAKFEDFFDVGDKIKVTYDGTMAMSSPPQITNISSIELAK